MTCREKLKLEHPEEFDYDDEPYGCPVTYGYLADDPVYCEKADCEECWNREVQEEDLCSNCVNLGLICNSNDGNKACPHVPHPFSDRIIMCEHHEPVKKVWSTPDNNEEIFKEPVDVTIGDIPLQDISYDGVEPCSIKDSGARREFATGAVRDIQEGKGRCDLLPLDVVACFLGSPGLDNNILYNIRKFTTSNDICYLYNALDEMSLQWNDGKTKESYERIVKQRRCGMILEVSKHFEDGAKKYGEYNWQKGIPTHCYIDSAVRHYLKHLRGDKDEPHDRAFVWNILCCIWTCIHKPELNDYARKEE